MGVTTPNSVPAIDEIRSFRNDVINGDIRKLNEITKPYLYPVPQINYGLAISNIASSAIDISDGIFQDLSHLISCSGVGCNINLDKVQT